MIGKIYNVLLPFFNIRTGQMDFKARPALILSDARNNDYTILPLSTISKKENVDSEYDIKLNPSICASLGLWKECYIRTHKQTVAHRSEIGRYIGNLKQDYPNIFKDVMLHLKQFNKMLSDNADT